MITRRRACLPPLLLCLAASLPIAGCGPGDRHPTRAAGATPPDTASGGPLGAADGGDGAPSAGESLAIGLGLFRQGDYKGAEPHLLAALKTHPREPRLLEALGSIEALTDRWKQAEGSFRAALAVDGASIGARLGLAAVFVDTGRYDDAAAALAEVRARDPGNLAAMLKGALLDTRLGRAAEGETGAPAVVSSQPRSAEAHFVLGLALEQQGRLAEAATEMQGVVAIAPGHRGALSHLVTIETRRGRAAEAQRWRKAQEAALSRAHVEERVRDHRILGVAAFNREDYAKALVEFQAIAREDPGDPQVHLHLGSTYIGLQRLPEG